MSYIQVAQEFIRKAQQLVAEHSNETKIRDNFTSYLRNMFPDSSKWVSYHIEGAETHVHLIRKNRTISGFIDNCIDSIAIEYEKNLTIKSIFDEGYRQVKEYCSALVRENVSMDLILGVLSDTLNWYVYTIEPDSSLNIVDYNQDTIKLKEVARLNITENDERQAADLLLFLQRYLGREGAREITANNLADDFGLQSTFSQGYIHDIENYIDSNITHNPVYYQMIEGLWKKFVESYSDSYDNKESYIGEFYISIIAKLLCANLISHKALSSSTEELVDIINGRFFENRNIQNFVDYDYFGWLNKDILEIANVLSAIQDDLKVYDFSRRPNEDLFGGLLVQLGNKTQRLMLGQDLTPMWLSKELVHNVVSMLPPGVFPRFVDMCCGSGSMIVATIFETIERFTSEKSKSERDRIIKECIAGFDIDPLAVILAKINWLINVFDLIDDSIPVFIPIYHADSLFTGNPLTQKIQFDDNTPNRLILLDKNISMPSYVIYEQNDVFDIIVNKCYDCINIEIDKNSFCDVMKRTLAGKVTSDKVEELTQFSYDLYLTLYQLNKDGKNGIWSFVLKNSFRPILIHHTFNGIVTNTPWLTLSKVNSNPYKVGLKAIARKMAIDPTDSSFPHLDIATVFLLSSIERFLKNDGIFGCILPDSVMTGKQHEKFRQGNFTQKNIKANFHSMWEIPTETFNNRSVAIFGKKEDFVKRNRYTGRVYSDINEYTEQEFYVSESVSRSVWSTSQGVESNEVNTKYSFTQGADIMPRCFFFFDYENNGQNYRIKSLTKDSKLGYFLQNMHVGAEKKYYCAGVPKSLFKPVVVSNNITAFSISSLPLALLPIEKIEGKWKPLSLVSQLALPRPTLNLLNKIDSDYKCMTNKKDLFKNALDMYNKLTKQSHFDSEIGKYLVLYGAGGSNLCSAYMKITGEIIIDQTLYWTVVDSEEEAIYLLAMLNCPKLNEIITTFQPQGLFGKRHIHTLPLDYIPVYDGENDNMNRLISITKLLIEELMNSLPSNLLDPNNGSLASRRRKISLIMTHLSSFIEYVSICEDILICANSEQTYSN